MKNPSYYIVHIFKASTGSTITWHIATEISVESLTREAQKQYDGWKVTAWECTKAEFLALDRERKELEPAQ